MEFVKKHYEKVLLSVILVGLAVVAAFLPLKVAAVKREIQAKVVVPREPIEYTPVSLDTNRQVLQRLEQDTQVKLEGRHNLFNPVKWQQKLPEGNLIKIETGDEVGLGALQVTNITPLYFRLEFQDVRKGRTDVRYRIGVTREANPNPRLRGTIPRYVSRKSPRNDPIILKEVIGAEENPDQLVLELMESKQEVRIGPGEPYERVGGYTATLVYQPENQVFNDQRVGNQISFAGATYNIVAITADGVTVESVSNDKRTTIAYNANAAP